MAEFKEIMVSYPQPVVSFDVNLGPDALAEGLVYDVNIQALWKSLLAGGVAPEDINKYPIIFTETSQTGRKGAFTNMSEFNDDQPALILRSYEGDGSVTTSTVAHEAKHMADYIEMGEDAFMSPAMKRIRKIAVTAANALLVGSLVAIDLHRHISEKNLIIDLGVDLFEFDILLSAAYTVEYLLRDHERRARRAAKKIVERNVLIVTKNGEERDLKSDARTHPFKAPISLVRSIFVPNFRI